MHMHASVYRSATEIFASQQNFRLVSHLAGHPSFCHLALQEWSKDIMLSAQVSVQPQLPGLAVEALPESVLERTVLSKVLPRDAWDVLRRAAYKRSGRK